MNWWSLEQGKTPALADLGFYAAAVVALLLLLWQILPERELVSALVWIATGLAGWSLAEYGLHRWVLHGLQPFKRWHALHHARPRAWIATPTAMTAALFAALVAAPAWWLLPAAQACALLLGVQLGYLGYIVVHHAVHHGHGRSAWLKRMRRWHARHHGAGAPCCYGVSLPLWDHVFGSGMPEVRQRTDAAIRSAYKAAKRSPFATRRDPVRAASPPTLGIHAMNPCIFESAGFGADGADGAVAPSATVATRPALVLVASAFLTDSSMVVPLAQQPAGVGEQP